MQKHITQNGKANPDTSLPRPKPITFQDFPKDYCDQIREAAHAAAKQGYQVLPLIPGRKEPVGKSNPDKSRPATCDPKKIDQWWPANTPPENVCGLGIRTGDGIGVLDVDVKDFPDGVNPHAPMLEELWADFPIRISTPRGGNGEHVPFSNDGSIPTMLKPGGRGIDILATEKNYVVAPPTWLITVEPSKRPDGTEKKDGHPGGRYTYRNDSKSTYGITGPNELPPLNPDLLEIIDKWKGKPGRPQKAIPMQSIPAAFAGEAEAYIIDRCRKYLNKLEHHQGGQRGHCKLIHAACVIAGDYGLRGAEGRQLFEEWNAVSTHPDGPEDARQMERKWAAGLAMTEGKPSNKRAECLIDWQRKKLGGIRESGSSRHQDFGQKDTDNRTPILVRKGEEHRVADEIAAALIEAKVPIYRQDSNLKVIYQAVDSELKKPGKSAKVEWSTSTERTTVGGVKFGWLRKRISEHCRLYTERTTKSGEVIEVPTDTTQALVEMLAQSPERFPHLAGLALGPIIGIDDDGRLLNTQGYDTESKLYLSQPVNDLVIPDRCSLEDAKKAEREIWKLVSGFPWREVKIDYPRWLAFLFTGALRYQLFEVPIGLINAPAAGSGKSLLAKLIGIILHGKNPVPMSWPKDKDGAEVRKRLAGHCHAADSLVLCDDLPPGCEFNSDELRTFATEREYYDRLLGQNTGGKAGGPQRCQLIFTGNAIAPHSDMVQRVLVCNLEPKETDLRLKNADKAWPGVGIASDYAHRNRTKLLAAVLTIVRAYRQAGSPVVDGQSYSFTDWTEKVCCLVRWLTGHDPLAGLALEWQATDSEASSLLEFIETWIRTIGEHRYLTASEIVSKVYGSQGGYPDPELSPLREIIPELVFIRDNSSPTPKRIGQLFRNYANRPVKTESGNYCLSVTKNREHKGNGLFGVRKIRPSSENAE